MTKCSSISSSSRSSSIIRSTNSIMSQPNEERNERTSINIQWSHEELVQASRLALLQHHHQSEKTSNSFESNKNFFWSDNESDISCSEHNCSRKNESEIQILNPYEREFIHSSFIPKNRTVQTKQEKYDLHDRALTNVQILDNDIMCLGSIAAHTALIAARGEEEDDDYVQKKKRRRSDKETLLCCASFTQKEAVQSSFSPAQELIPKNILSRAEVSQPFINTTERTTATTAAAAEIAAATTTTASGTTVTYSNHVMEEWDRMLDKRPSTSDVVGLTQWLLKLYALATPSSEAAIITSAQGG